MTRSKNADAIGWCEACQKLMYTDRRRAKSVGKQHHPHKGTYVCPANGLMFHVGSLPEAIKQGHITRSEYYGGAA
jgi:hypothetical protein